MSEHVDYPHDPGRLYDCAACEQGPCTCTDTDAPCVSAYCTHVDSESARQAAAFARGNRYDGYPQGSIGAMWQ